MIHQFGIFHYFLNLDLSLDLSPHTLYHSCFPFYPLSFNIAICKFILIADRLNFVLFFLDFVFFLLPSFVSASNPVFLCRHFFYKKCPKNTGGSIGPETLNRSLKVRNSPDFFYSFICLIKSGSDSRTFFTLAQSCFRAARCRCRYLTALARRWV